MSNNLFSFATKELSQDAFICWSINWLNYPECPQYALGKGTMDMFLGNKKQEKYYNVEIKRQYNSIDVLVLFNDTYALIVEDKTNTSEHNDQIARYEEKIRDKYPEKNIILSYVKTGIMYDVDCRMADKVDVVVDLNGWIEVIDSYKGKCKSEIVDDFSEFLREKRTERDRELQLIAEEKYAEAAQSEYGQLALLEALFEGRTRGTVLCDKYYKVGDGKENPLCYVDEIYNGTNWGGTPWAQYCFWGRKHDNQYKQEEKAITECEFVFWRVDYSAKGYYLALRHYDEQVGTAKGTNYYNAYMDRKRTCYDKVLGIAKKAVEATKLDDRIKKEIFEIRGKGQKDPYKCKESNVLILYLDKIDAIGGFEAIKHFVCKITKDVAEKLKREYSQEN